MRIILSMLLLVSFNTFAEGLQIKTGRWETTTTSSNSMMPDPKTMTTTSCIDTGVFKPQDMLNGAENCEITESSVEDNTLSFEMTCLVQGSSTSVKGSFFSEGHHGEGNMTMIMKMGQMEMQLANEWTSRYLGPCD